jgi:hypothetical protein
MFVNICKKIFWKHKSSKNIRCIEIKKCKVQSSYIFINICTRKFRLEFRMNIFFSAARIEKNLPRNRSALHFILAPKPPPRRQIYGKVHQTIFYFKCWVRSTLPVFHILSPQHAAHLHAQFLNADASTARRLAAPRTAQAIHRSSIRPHLPPVSTLHPFLCSPRCQEIHGRVDLSHPGLRLTSICGPVLLCGLGHLISLVASPRRVRDKMSPGSSSCHFVFPSVFWRHPPCSSICGIRLLVDQQDARVPQGPACSCFLTS